MGSSSAYKRCGYPSAKTALSQGSLPLSLSPSLSNPLTLIILPWGGLSQGQIWLEGKEDHGPHPSLSEARIMMGGRSNGPGAAVAQAYVVDVRDGVGRRARLDIRLNEKVRQRFVGAADRRRRCGLRGGRRCVGLARR